MLHISFNASVRSLDPSVGIDYPSAFVTKMLFEGLMYIGPDGQIQPAILDRYEISEDRKTYFFYLKPCFWSNGDPLTASDFEYSWKKVIDPTKQTLGADNFYPIKNARAATLGEVSIDQVGITALDKTTLKVELEHPTPYFLEMLSTSSYLPINEKTDRENPKWSNQDGAAFVCNGPYQLESHRFDNEIVVRKNPSYWNAERVTMPCIHIAVVKDTSTQLSLYEKNQLDWLGKPFSKIPVDALEHLKSKGDINFYKTIGLYWYFINVESFPFQNKKIRKAFAYAIDREAIVEHILQGKEVPAMGILPYSIATQPEPFFQDNQPYLALQLFEEGLEEMGISRKDIPEIVINYSDATIHSRVAEALQEQWTETFGIKVRLEHQDWKAHFAKLQKGNFQVGGMGWQSWLRDPIYIMQTFRDKEGGVNMSRWESSRYQTLLKATNEETDLIKRNNLFNQAEALLMDEMPVIPVYFSTMAFAKSDTLKNVYISELYEVDFRWSYFEDE